MATFLDVGVIGLFSTLFLLLLVYAIVWGLLSWINPFGDKAKSAYAIIGILAAFFVVISKEARMFVQFITPWFIVLVIFLFFIVFLIGIFGIGGKEGLSKIMSQPKTYTWLIIIIVVIIAGGLAHTFGQTALESQPGYTPPEVPVEGNISEVSQVGYPSLDYTSGYAPPGSTATPSFKVNLINTLIHPKVLGILLVFLIGAVTIYFLSLPSFRER